LTESKDDDVDSVYSRLASFAHHYCGLELSFRAGELGTIVWLTMVLTAKTISVLLERMRLTADDKIRKGLKLQGDRSMNKTCSLKGAVVAALVLIFFDQGGAADLTHGRNIALRWCSQCHVVASGQTIGSDSVPTFAQISQSMHLDETRLSAFLANPQHSRMPNLSLTRAEIADLTAYIKAQHR